MNFSCMIFLVMNNVDFFFFEIVNNVELKIIIMVAN